MVKHLESGLKYVTVHKLKELEFSTQEIAKILKIDRTTVSHYLHGRNLSLRSIEVAKVILDLTPQDSFRMVYSLCQNKDLTFTILKYCLNNPKIYIKNTCIGCGLCVEICVMDALKLNNDLNCDVNLDYCCGCLLCIENCPTNSIEILDEEQ
ncbi:4Fe-4S binding protein [Methanobrevibacter sp.]